MHRQGWLRPARCLAALWFGVVATARAQEAVVTGRVTDASTGQPLHGATASIEGTVRFAITDPSGRFRLTAVPGGPQILRIIAVGFAPVRRPVTIPPSGELTADVALARSALTLPNIVVTADVASRARGELGTASVIGEDAIRNQTAASLAGLLELVPGAVLQPPGLDAVQQFAIRAVPVSNGAGGQGSDAANPSADQLASFGTQIVFDGVPLSNNANLQTLGPRGEQFFSTAVGGGIDLRRLPATTVERLEVIRGLPSVRFGDLTQGVILVETRAGAVDPEVRLRADARTLEGSLVGGREVGGHQFVTASFDLARTAIAPGETDDIASRYAAQLAHRYEGATLRLDTRVDAYQLLEDRPPNERTPDISQRVRDKGFRVSERARWRWSGGRGLEVTAAVESGDQSARLQTPMLRAAMPFTDRLTEGRQTGKFVAGSYLAVTNLDGAPRHLYLRSEYATPSTFLGLSHQLRGGFELRREWNAGAGYQFDIEFPPQSSFTGVQGFDRPRRFDDLPPLVTSTAYLDDRISEELGGTRLSMQAGLRADLLHGGDWWASSVRDVVVQPRLQLEVAPSERLRFRAGAGRMSKTPGMASLSPGLQYHDLVNVNYYANNPAERLAVLTTRILDKTNPDLQMAVADKLEFGLEAGIGSTGLVALSAYAERTRDAVGIRTVPTWLPRERFAIDSSNLVPGQPPGYLEPAYATDTIPVLIDRPDNNLRMKGRGLELTAFLPEWRPARTQLALQASWGRSEVANEGLEFSQRFSDFQLDPRRPRAPFWDGTTRTGERGVMITRLIHHQPGAGLLITGTVQWIFHEQRETLAATDTLSWAGYITRKGDLVRVPENERGNPEYADLRSARTDLPTDLQKAPPGLLFGLQVSKTLPLDGRLSFYAFNLFDQRGNYGDVTTTARLYPAFRYGLELTLPLGLSWGVR